MLNMDPLQRQVWRLLTVVVFISVINVPLVSAYCWQVGQNPYVAAQPSVQEVALRTVRVTWEGIVQNERCVDNYLVKYWQKSDPQGYQMTELIDKQHYTSDIIVIPKVNYVFQVIAREDKGGVLGIDYNKSDQKEFKTSAYNSNVKPTTPKPAVVPKATVADNDNIVGPASDLQDEVVREENGGKLLAGFNIELIAIIIVCSIVLLLILVGLIYKLTCAKKTEDIDDDDDEDEHDDDGDDFEKERLDV